MAPLFPHCSQIVYWPAKRPSSLRSAVETLPLAKKPESAQRLMSIILTLIVAVAAFNLVDYGTTKAMAAAAEELNAPVICQTSTKTIQYWSHKEIVSWVRTVAEDSPVPVVLHLDHCKDLAMIEACASASSRSGA